MTLWVLAPLFELFEAKTVCTRQQLKYSNAPLECGGTGFEDEYEDDEGGAPVQVGGGVRLPQRYKLIGNIGAPVSPTPPSFGTFRQVIIFFITIFTRMLIAQCWLKTSKCYHLIHDNHQVSGLLRCMKLLMWILSTFRFAFIIVITWSSAWLSNVIICKQEVEYSKM